MKNTKRLLLVEDESDLRSLYAELLSDKGYTIIEAEDGETTLNYLKEERIGFDLVLLDEIIPKLKGTEILKILKTDKSIKKPKKIVLMTNLDKESIQKKLKEIGCDKVEYVIKSSITPMDFLNLVENKLKY